MPQARHFSSSARSDITFTNTIISDNRGGNCGAVTPDIAFVDGGRNLQHPRIECGAQVPAADPQIDSMYVPAFGSPAFGKGDNTVCMAKPVDARDVYGQVRPRANACSIGAVEGEMEQLGRKHRRSSGMSIRSVLRRPPC